MRDIPHPERQRSIPPRTSKVARKNDRYCSPGRRDQNVPTPQEKVSFARLQQLIRIDVDGDCDVFGEGQFVDSFAHVAAQMHDGFAAEQDVEAELAL